MYHEYVSMSNVYVMYVHIVPCTDIRTDVYAYVCGPCVQVVYGYCSRTDTVSGHSLVCIHVLAYVHTYVCTYLLCLVYKVYT